MTPYPSIVRARRLSDRSNPPLPAIQPLEPRWLLTELVDRTPGGDVSNGNSGAPALSADGRYVAFTSTSTDLVRGVADRNRTSDVFVRDTLTGDTQLVTRSVIRPRSAANAVSDDPSLSADGRYLAFMSDATDLVPGISGISSRIYLYDRLTKQIRLVSATTDGSPATYTINGTLYQDAPSYRPHVTGDGRHVFYQSYAENLLAGPTRSPGQAIYRFDLGTGANKLVVAPRPGVREDYYGATASFNGATVAFTHFKSGSKTTTEVLNLRGGQLRVFPGSGLAALDRDASHVAHYLPLDREGSEFDLVIDDLRSGARTRVVRRSTTTWSFSLSDDASRLAYALNEVEGLNVYTFEPKNSRSTLLSRHWRTGERIASTDEVVISRDGKDVYFSSLGAELVPPERGLGENDQHVYRVGVDDASGQITGTIWKDLDQDQNLEADEPVIRGALVFLDDNKNGRPDDGEPRTRSDARGRYAFRGVANGKHVVVYRPPSGSALSWPSPASKFDIDFTFAGGVSGKQRSAFQQAATDWSRVIIGDLPDVGAIDDILIRVTTGQLSGDALAAGAPGRLRGGASALPYEGAIMLDLKALGSASPGTLYAVALHEIGHALGFGTLWQRKRLLSGHGQSTRYIGARALDQYRDLFHPGAAGVPLDQEQAHWSGDWTLIYFIYDVMRADLVADGEAYISPTTAAAMQDLGYSVSVRATDDTPFSRRPLVLAPSRALPHPAYSVTLKRGQFLADLDFGVAGASPSR